MKKECMLLFRLTDSESACSPLVIVDSAASKKKGAIEPPSSQAATAEPPSLQLAFEQFREETTLRWKQNDLKWTRNDLRWKKNSIELAKHSMELAKLRKETSDLSATVAKVSHCVLIKPTNSTYNGILALASRRCTEAPRPSS